MAPILTIRSVDGTVIEQKTWKDGQALTHAELLSWLFDWARIHLDGREIAAIGHRVVHGGPDFAVPRLVDEALLGKLESFNALAPLHQPHNLAAISAIAKLAPGLPQVACFDTAFHHDRPRIATRFAIPRALHDQGIRRYGFHGLSYEYISKRLAELDPGLAAGRVIAAHLGNGASLCAMASGRSVDTTMGFTALDGLVMGTRCGAIDPGVVLHLLEAAIWIWMPLYLLLMQKRVYGQGWPMTLLKYAVLGWCYIVLLSFGAAFTAIAGLVWM